MKYHNYLPPNLKRRTETATVDRFCECHVRINPEKITELEAAVSFFPERLRKISDGWTMEIPAIDGTSLILKLKEADVESFEFDRVQFRLFDECSLDESKNKHFSLLQTDDKQMELVAR